MTFSTLPDPSVVHNVHLHQPPSCNGTRPQVSASSPGSQTSQPASGDKAKAHAILAAIRTLQAVEQAQRPATPEL